MQKPAVICFYRLSDSSKYITLISYDISTLNDEFERKNNLYLHSLQKNYFLSVFDLFSITYLNILKMPFLKRIFKNFVSFCLKQDKIPANDAKKKKILFSL